MLKSDFFQESTKAERGLGLLGDAEETAANDCTQYRRAPFLLN